MILFADTHYWIAMCDPWRELARAAREREGLATVVTTDEVLVELLNSFSGRGAYLRKVAVNAVFRLRRDPGVRVIEQSKATFDAGLIMYDGRHDKGYSLVDCISMNTMRSIGIQKVLTNDQHFAKEGFTVLVR